MYTEQQLEKIWEVAFLDAMDLGASEDEAAAVADQKIRFLRTVEG